ncbi:MAG: flavodoxin-dependent (E)-4-hydroxy-3-methylbut-2-enyl-diphosphate synthase, partial [Christensenellaceae bacterium]
MKSVFVGNVRLGDAPVAIQSMCTTKTSDIEGTVAQIKRLEEAGCEIIRCSVLDEADALAFGKIKERISIPVVADIHFSHRLAVQAIESGADKVRINPGNIGGEREIAIVADCIRAHHIPVRVGSNTGSIEPQFLARYGRNEFSLVESALMNVNVLEKHGVNDIVISVKASSVPLTVRAYRLLRTRTDYPLHVGVTEAGTNEMGVVKSAIGIGALLLDGIGETLRVSLNEDPVEEVYAAQKILRAVGMDENFVDVVACPTCGRCQWNSMELAHKVQAFVLKYKVKAKVAVMGCVVNGPGEAKDADIGIAGGKGVCVIFRKGEIVKRVSEAEAEEVF